MSKCKGVLWDFGEFNLKKLKTKNKEYEHIAHYPTSTLHCFSICIAKTTTYNACIDNICNIF